MRSVIAIAAIAMAAAAVQAQPASGYTGPSATAQKQAPRGYSGQSNVPLVTVQQLLDAGRDGQDVRLQGRLVAHERGDRYTFADDSGRIEVEIDDDVFPPGQPVSAEQRVELVGEFDKGRRSSKVEVDRLRLLP